MVRRPFFGLGKPKLKYPAVNKDKPDTIKEIPLPQKVTLFMKHSNLKPDDLILKIGDNVRTGQNLELGGEGGI